MSVIHHSLFLVIQRFPSDKECLVRLYQYSKPFQALCDDYLKCIKAINHWSRSESSNAGKLVNEYREIKKSLEDEIKERLDVMW
jgi:hypothetical protein|nr:hypothetical protein [uncultured Desulfobacter sp.]